MSFISLMMAARAAIVALAMVASLLSRPFLVLSFIWGYLIGLRLGGLIGLAGLTCKDTQRR